ncbi:MAG TPA: hypothetical protein VFV95_20490 [Vicinamibacterales bacterium]|nr:hypothetical protein [Vicinamibacterales bacterium]
MTVLYSHLQISRVASEPDRPVTTSDDILGIERNFTSLSMKDLLEARDQYHWHLIHKANVVGTAVGLYRIRRSDPWPDDRRSDADEARAQAAAPKGERTFENSEVRDYSWPCVMVLVEQWQYPSDFGGASGLGVDQMIPKRLYLPDGRMVPVCVIKVTRSEPDNTLLPAWHWPEHLIGGGFPITVRSQGRTRVASVGGLVTDGHLVYALTSRHVAGPSGHTVGTVLRGHAVAIGHSTDRQLTRKPFSEVYREFPGRRTFLTLDASLVAVSTLDDWTSQVYGLSRVGPLADLSELNISTRLINAEVRAYGAASGALAGRIAALFYRHRSIGGYDDVTDFLIAPEPGEPHSQPGDSGTIWHLVQRGGLLRPIALQWGGQAFVAGGDVFNFALAASLTNVLRLLEVELVVDHNIGAQPFWGKTGHYTLATFACREISNASPKLQALMLANQDRISFREADLVPDDIDAATKRAKKEGRFVPLADVPDVIWKNVAAQVDGGRDTSLNQGPEHPVHYADIDEPRPSDGLTLRQLSLANPANVSVPIWQAFYTECRHKASREWGLLPFRVWQFFDAMVDALERNNLTEYVCAAGLLAHYVGDACQPLHGSVLADGHSDGRGKGIHSAYETAMVDHQAKAILEGFRRELPVTSHPPFVTSGHGSAVAIVELMDRAAGRVDPAALVDTYAATPGGKSKAVTSVLWEAFGEGTIGTLCDGAVTLAMIWESAWKKGLGEQRFTSAEMVAINKNSLRAKYEKPSFVPSLDLDHIQPVLKGHP